MRLAISHTSQGTLQFSPIDASSFQGPRIAGSVIYTRDFFGKLVNQEKHHPSYSISYRMLRVKKQVDLVVRENIPGLRMEIVLDGEIIIKYRDNKWLHLKKGDYYLTTEPYYILKTVADSNSSVMVLYFEAMRDYIAQNPTAEPPKDICYRLTSTMNSRVNYLLDHAMDPDSHDQFYENVIKEMVKLLVVEYERSKEKENRYLQKVLQVDAIICRDLNVHYSIRKLAKMVGINECTLKKQYARYFNMGMYERRRGKKLDWAKDLLETTDMPIRDIALRIGYLNDDSFNKMFKKFNDVPPGEWRQLNKKP